MLPNEYLLAKIGFDTAESEPSDIFFFFFFRATGWEAIEEKTKHQLVKPSDILQQILKNLANVSLRKCVFGAKDTLN